MTEPVPAWRAPALLGVGTVAATITLGVGNPNTTHIPLCPLKAMTGLDCPFCGGLRAVHSLAHLHPIDAASHNLLFTVAVPFLVAGWAVWMVRAWQDPRNPNAQPHLARPASIALVVALAAFFVARNLPALSWLGSTA